jgi:hypothetical protein
MPHCPDCGALIEKGYKFCPSCGKTLGPKLKVGKPIKAASGVTLMKFGRLLALQEKVRTQGSYTWGCIYLAGIIGFFTVVAFGSKEFGWGVAGLIITMILVYLAAMFSTKRDKLREELERGLS